MISSRCQMAVTSSANGTHREGHGTSQAPSLVFVCSDTVAVDTHPCAIRRIRRAATAL
jgi:hypothetical protein